MLVASHRWLMIMRHVYNLESAQLQGLRIARRKGTSVQLRRSGLLRNISAQDLEIPALKLYSG